MSKVELTEKEKVEIFDKMSRGISEEQLLKIKTAIFISKQEEWVEKNRVKKNPDGTMPFTFTVPENADNKFFLEYIDAKNKSLYMLMAALSFAETLWPDVRLYLSGLEAVKSMDILVSNLIKNDPESKFEFLSEEIHNRIINKGSKEFAKNFNSSKFNYLSNVLKNLADSFSPGNAPDPALIKINEFLIDKFYEILNSNEFKNL